MFSSLYFLGLLQRASGLIIATLCLAFPTDVIESWIISTWNFEVWKLQFGQWTINGDCVSNNWIARRKLVDSQMFCLVFFEITGIGNIQLLMNVSSCVVWEHRTSHLSNCIVGTCMVFLYCECGGGLSDFLLDWMTSRTLYSDVTSLRNGWAYVW